MTVTIVPYLYYEDVAAAIDFLTRAFGFKETLRFDDDGRIEHAEMVLGDAKIMMGGPGPDYRSPKTGGHSPALGINVTVDDVDAHYAQAKAAGAEITRDLADQEYGVRSYIANDPEGHHWFFDQPLD